MNVIANGYFESLILLAECCLNNNDDKKADAIELYEKSICWSLNILLGYKASFKDNHDIRGIWFWNRA